MKTRSPLTRPLVIAITLAATFSLTGCFSNPIENIVQGGVDKAIEDATGGDIETGGDLPDDFPSEVPLLSDNIEFAMGIDNEESKGWSVMIATDDPQAATEKIPEQLEAAGFTQDLWNVADGMVIGGYSSDTYGVTIGIVWSEGEESETQVTYTVIDVSASK